MRKAIIKWLLGIEIKTYFDLLVDHSKQINRNIELLKETDELTKRLIEEKEQHLETLNLTEKIIEGYKKLKRICEENGIDVEEI